MLLDSYNIASGNLQVLGRYNSVSSTETDIEREISFTIERTEEKDDEKDDGYDLASEPEYRRVSRREEDMAAVAPQSEVRFNAVNYSIDQLYYKPSGCQNSFETFPKDLRTLLPYLCDPSVIDNLQFTNPKSDIISSRVIDNFQTRYNPRHLNNYVVGMYNGANIRLNAHSVLAEGLIPADQIQFAGEDSDGYLECTYGVANLSISCHPAYVRIKREVFGLNAGDEWRQFDFAAPLHPVFPFQGS